MNKETIYDLLRRAANVYYAGTDLILSDEQFDKLSDIIKYEEVGKKPTENTAKHLVPMYSLKKCFTGEDELPDSLSNPLNTVESPKLDGAALAIYYVDGKFSHALTRGDGEVGQVITDKISYILNVPPIDTPVFSGIPLVQVCGEVVVDKSIKNARNYVAGAFGLNSAEEFATREPMYFHAYSIYPTIKDTYKQDMWSLEHEYGFGTVLNVHGNFNQDGVVLRLNNNSKFEEEGYTNHHPRGAVAVKTRKAGVETTLLDVVWQVGKSGRITPVALLKPVIIDGANIGKATLNNVSFIKALDLHIGDIVEVVRSGDIIPMIVGKRKLSIDFNSPTVL